MSWYLRGQEPSGKAGRGCIWKEGMWFPKALAEERHSGRQKSLCKGSEVGTNSRTGMKVHDRGQSRGLCRGDVGAAGEWGGCHL